MSISFLLSDTKSLAGAVEEKADESGMSLEGRRDMDLEARVGGGEAGDDLRQIALQMNSQSQKIRNHDDAADPVRGQAGYSRSQIGLA